MRNPFDMIRTLNCYFDRENHEKFSINRNEWFFFHFRANEKLSNLCRGTISLILFSRVEKKLILYNFKLKAKKIKYDMEFLMDSNNFFEINVFSMRQNERD